MATAAFWFSPYSSDDWTPDKGYNEFFREVVYQIRDWFGLTKDPKRTAMQVGTGKYVPYTLRKRKLFIAVKEFTYGDYTQGQSDHISPKFLLQYVIAETPNGSRVLSMDTLCIEFPRDYPRSWPYFRLDNPELAKIGPSHRHHLLLGGLLCLASGSDWNPRKDTIITALNWAFDWIVWHKEEFGW